MPSPVQSTLRILTKQPLEHLIQKPSFPKKPVVLEGPRGKKLTQLNTNTLQNFQSEQSTIHHERQWHHRQRPDFF